MSHYQACALCGVEGPQVRIALVEWAVPDTSEGTRTRFSSIPRCTDIPDCKQRVQQLGDDWPLVEPRPSHHQHGRSQP